MKLVEGYKGTARVRLAAESGEVDGGCWAWESIKPTWASGLQAGTVNIVLQTTEKSHPELKKVPLAMQYAKTEEARALLHIASGPYSKGARPYSVPPGLPQDRRPCARALLDRGDGRRAGRFDLSDARQ